MTSWRAIPTRVLIARPTFVGTVLFGMLAFAAGCALPYHVPGQDPYAAQAIPPDIRSDAIAAFPDPAHVRVTDGRIYRMAGVPDCASSDPNFEPRRARLHAFFFDQRYPEKHRPLGFRLVGADQAGEQVVELWSYPDPVGICGNTTAAELRAMVRHWYRAHDELLLVLGLSAPDRRTGERPLRPATRPEDSVQAFGSVPPSPRGMNTP